MMGRERADHDLAIFSPGALQLRQPPDVDQHVRFRQPQLHDREQAVAARDQLGAVTMLLQK